MNREDDDSTSKSTEGNNKRIVTHLPMSPPEVADYVFSVVTPLRKVARDGQLTLLSYLLEMACEEALARSNAGAAVPVDVSVAEVARRSRKSS